MKINYNMWTINSEVRKNIGNFGNVGTFIDGVGMMSRNYKGT